MRTYGEVIEVRTADPVGASDPDGPGPDRLLRSAASAQLLAPPAQFLWRGRLYLVREVLAHWVEVGAWWTARAPRTSSPASATATTTTPTGATTGPPVTGGAEAPRTARSVAADVGAVEREVWRVEAASGRTSRVGVYDLVRDVPAATGPGTASWSSSAPGPSGPPPPARWRLARALD